uniref:VOC domain-containing protein n=1 Tax=Zonotrichia albicollis TaxID=44394 RepID=A0A8D2MME2_ZONAL
MAASLSRPCFISLHLPYRQGWGQHLANTFRFQPVAVRETPRVRQLALRRESAIFLVNERLAPAREFTSSHDFLYDVDPQPTLGTASNVCFEVDDVPGLCKRLQSQGCSLLVPPTELSDEGGSVTYGVVSSVVGNISHTLLDRSSYRGLFLPGFQPIQGAPSATGDGIRITHFDHITYVLSSPRLLGDPAFSSRDSIPLPEAVDDGRAAGVGTDASQAAQDPDHIPIHNSCSLAPGAAITMLGCAPDKEGSWDAPRMERDTHEANPQVRLGGGCDASQSEGRAKHNPGDPWLVRQRL